MLTLAILTMATLAGAMLTMAMLVLWSTYCGRASCGATAQVRLFESEDICRHLLAKYGNGAPLPAPEGGRGGCGGARV